MSVYRHFFAWLGDEALKVVGVSDLRVHIDGFAPRSNAWDGRDPP
jgi:hypothetical protein